MLSRVLAVIILLCTTAELTWGIPKSAQQICSHYPLQSLAYFGLPLRVSGERLLIGEGRLAEGGTRRGDVYIFERQAGSQKWVSQASLWQVVEQQQPELAKTIAVFGFLGVLDHHGAVVNYQTESRKNGLISFRKGVAGWRFESHFLFESQGVSLPEEFFPAAMDFKSDRMIVVFTTGRSDSFLLTHIYRRIITQEGTQWKLESEIPLSKKSVSSFVPSVAMHHTGLMAFVGGFSTPPEGDRLGSVAVLRYSPAKQAWEQKQTLVPFDGQVDTSFGQSISVKGDILVVGAPQAGHRRFRGDSIYDGKNAPDMYVPWHERGQGLVYTYYWHQNQWNAGDILSTYGRSSTCHFGSCVALNRHGILAVGGEDAQTQSRPVQFFQLQDTQAHWTGPIWGEDETFIFRIPEDMTNRESHRFRVGVGDQFLAIPDQMFNAGAGRVWVVEFPK